MSPDDRAADRDPGTQRRIAGARRTALIVTAIAVAVYAAFIILTAVGRGSAG